MRRGLQVLREREFRLVYGAQVVSLLGDGIIPVALAFAVLDLTGSATDLGLVLAARTLPMIGSLLAGGVLADPASFAISAALLARVRVVEHGRGAQTSFLTDLREGWTELRTRTWAWTVIAAFSLINVIIAPFYVLGPLIADRRMGGASAWA